MAERFSDHSSSTGRLAGTGGPVEFFFGLELDSGNGKDAERVLKEKLSSLGFSRITVSETLGRTHKTFFFNEKSLLLVYDVICGLRFVYPAPTERLTIDHPGSIENPLLNQGLLPQDVHREALPSPSQLQPRAQDLQLEPCLPYWHQQLLHSISTPMLEFHPSPRLQYTNSRLHDSFQISTSRFQDLPASAAQPNVDLQPTLLPPLNLQHPHLATGLPLISHLPPLQPPRLPQAEHLFPSTPSSQSNKRARK